MFSPRIANVLFLSILTFSIPLDAQTTSSSHNIYLVTCTQHFHNAAHSFTALAYFANATASDAASVLGNTNLMPRERPRPHRPNPWSGPPTNNNGSSLRPDESAVIANPAVPWEAANVNVTLWVNTNFETQIDAGAQNSASGSIAGSAQLAGEDYVCFRDGTTVLNLVGKDWGEGGRNWAGWGNGGRGSCVANYWCGGLGV